MKSIFSFILISMALSCNNKDQNIEKFEASVRNYYLNDYINKESFKLDNITLQNYENSSFTENSIDSLRILVISGKIKNLKNQIDDKQDIENITTSLTRLEASSTNKSEPRRGKETINTITNEISFYKDSLNNYLRKDLLIKDKIVKRSNPEKVYKAKFIIKGSTLITGSKYHVSDTVYFYFDKNFTLLNLD